MLNLNKLNYQNLVDSNRRNKIIKTYEFKLSRGKYYCHYERSVWKMRAIKKVTPALRDANKRQNKIGGGGRNQSVRIYTTKRQKSRV